MSKKILYSFDVHKEKEVEKRVPSTNAEGKSIEVIEKTKEKVPIKIILYKPTKRQLDDAQFEYGRELNKMLNAGFLTKAMLAKSYKDKGGVFSEEEARLYNKLRMESVKKQDEIIRLGSKKENDKEAQEQWEKAIMEQETLRESLMDIETQFSTLFDHTAEKKAENHVILWYTLFLTHIQEEKDKDPIPYFDGDTYEEKLDSYYEKEEEENEFHTAVKNGVLLAVSFWMYFNAQRPEDFKPLENELNRTISMTEEELEEEDKQIEKEDEEKTKKRGRKPKE